MRILIADDEDLTRNGLIQNIDWNSLGIREIDQAADGALGLAAAKNHTPDIILTDVRMPRMDGIEMARAIQELNPSCSIIFMSGYSDKEYLKAAIKLHAVRYVEKPIALSEIQEAVSEAVSSINKKRLEERSSEFLREEEDSKLALKLTRSNFIPPRELMDKVKNSCFVTLVLRLYPSLAEYAEDVSGGYLKQISSLCKNFGFHELHTLKHTEFLILHLRNEKSISARSLKELCEKLIALFCDSEQAYLAAGPIVPVLTQIPDSYNAAVILMQSSFFHENGSILFYEKDYPALDSAVLRTMPETFRKAVSDLDLAAAKSAAVSYYEILRGNRSFLPTTVKDTYYRMLSDIEKSAYEAKLLELSDVTDSTSILSSISDATSLQALHALLAKKLDELNALLRSPGQKEENPTIFLIKDYIRQNYSNPSLSIKDISDHVNLSTSYLCTVFKTETGRTLNQYLAEYRMEKAKKLLRDPRNRIADISSLVGYSDGNYFGKSFKKMVGLSPSDFRERELS